MSKPDVLERALEEHGLPSISAAVFEDGEVTWADTAGDARPDTQYAIASVTKTFVAAAVLELGVDLDEPTALRDAAAAALAHVGPPAPAAR